MHACVSTRSHMLMRACFSEGKCNSVFRKQRRKEAKYDSCVGVREVVTMSVLVKDRVM